MKMLHVTVQTARFEEEIAFYRDIVGLTIRRDARPARRSAPNWRRRALSPGRW